MVSASKEKTLPASASTVSGKGLETVAKLYTSWLDAGRSNGFTAIVSSLALADLLHSAGLLKDSMYSRIGTFESLSALLTTGQAVASTLSTLAEAEETALSPLTDVLETVVGGEGIGGKNITAALQKLGLLDAAKVAKTVG